MKKLSKVFGIVLLGLFISMCSVPEHEPHGGLPPLPIEESALYISSPFHYETNVRHDSELHVAFDLDESTNERIQKFLSEATISNMNYQDVNIEVTGEPYLVDSFGSIGVYSLGKVSNYAGGINTISWDDSTTFYVGNNLNPIIVDITHSRDSSEDGSVISSVFVSTSEEMIFEEGSISIKDNEGIDIPHQFKVVEGSEGRYRVKVEGSDNIERMSPSFVLSISNYFVSKNTMLNIDVSSPPYEGSGFVFNPDNVPILIHSDSGTDWNILDLPDGINKQTILEYKEVD